MVQVNQKGPLWARSGRSGHLPTTTALRKKQKRHFPSKYTYAVKTTVAATESIIVVIGPQSRLSGFDRVIQLSKVTTDCIASADHAVQTGQCGQKPAADAIDEAIHAKIKIEMPAAMRFFLGSGPSRWPPWVKCPQGAPAIRAN